MAWDVLVKNGTLIDGTGREPVRADVAVQGERIAAIGKLDGSAARVIDAEGALVTPGFVDIHTHLDAQICWDPLATSPCWHGVTSVVMGNCGVTFAPCKPEDREFLARLMESVEDIPAKSIMTGMRWDWETYGEYLDSVDRLPKGVNVGGMVGHCAVRWWAMGKRSLEQKIAGEDDIARMREIVREAIRGGALGFSTSRTLLHKTPDGEPVPGTFAAPEELIGIGSVLGEEGRGVFEAVPYLDSTDADVIVGEVDWMERVSRANGRPLTFGMLQTRQFPDLWRTVLDSVEKANARGAQILPQTQVRSVGVLFGLVNLTPWDLAGGTWGLLKLISLEERLAAFRSPEKRAKLIEDSKKSPMGDVAAQVTSTCCPERDGATRYDLAPEDSLTVIANRRGVTPRRSLHGHRARDGRQGALHLPVREPGFRRGGQDALAHAGGARAGGLRRPLRPDHGRQPADLLAELLGAREGAVLDRARDREADVRARAPVPAGRARRGEGRRLRRPQRDRFRRAARAGARIRAGLPGRRLALHPARHRHPTHARQRPPLHGARPPHRRSRREGCCAVGPDPRATRR